jgi:hypothetical protein
VPLHCLLRTTASFHMPTPADATATAAAAAAAARRPRDRIIARLSVGLTSLLGEVDVPEDELVGKLRAGVSQNLAREARSAFHADVALALAGLATRPEAEVIEWLRERGLIISPEPPSPLLCRLLQELPLLFQAEVLQRLDPMALTMLAQVGRPWLAAVLASGLPRFPKGSTVRLELGAFCTSIERLARAKANGCPWGEPRSDDGWDNPCARAAQGGHLAVLQWARAHRCPWTEGTCHAAARGGHMEVLRWAREHHCPWNKWTCAEAAAGGHMEVLQWARRNSCPWGVDTCQAAAWGGHLEVLQWAREHLCPWEKWVCTGAAANGRLAVLRWVREHGCPWDKVECEYRARHHLDTLRWVREQPCDE